MPDPGNQEHRFYQRITFEAIRWYGRRKVRRAIKKVHRRLVTEQPNSALSRSLRRIFMEGKG